MTILEFTLGAILSLSPSTEQPGELALAIADAAQQDPIDGDARFTAALLVATAWRESSFVNFVGDGGHSCGPFQRWSKNLSECYLLIEDFDAAARMAREDIRQSLIACEGEPKSERLAGYLSGYCDKGKRQSRDRWAIARRLLASR